MGLVSIRGLARRYLLTQPDLRLAVGAHFTEKHLPGVAVLPARKLVD
jgi:hypothetical protein